MREILTSHQPGIIGVSGGVDSSFLAAAVRHWRLDYQAVFLAGPHIPPGEQRAATDFVCNLGLPYTIGSFSPLDVPGAADNGQERCYHCKTALVRVLKEQGKRGNEQIMDGSHLSDGKEYRPGRMALNEQGVMSPLADAGLVKEDIRAYARILGLEQADQPSRPCLMTRFAYGYQVSGQELKKVGQAEDELRIMGLSHFRLRILLDGRVVLHIHNMEQDMVREKAEEIDACIRRHGIPAYTLEVVQTLSGFFDRQSRENIQSSSEYRTNCQKMVQHF
ncbi:MAG: ATP-dependent sacrificial sulfur transferase LarE [Desulfovermiculus sp.]